MKKCTMIFVFCCLILLGGCSSKQNGKDNTNNNETISVEVNNAKTQKDMVSETTTSDIVEIKEKMFVTQINDIYLNRDEFLGKTIQLEGLFDKYTSEKTGSVYYSVYRNGPGCCGNDSTAGFDVIWDGTYPNINDWVKAVGILEIYEEDGSEFLRLKLSQLNVLDVRGKEYVNQ